MEDPNLYKRRRNAAPGGLGSFLLGLIMTLIGGYLLLNEVQVSSGGFWGWRYPLFGGFSVSPLGVTLILFLLGVGIVFFNTSSKVGWFLMGGGFLLIIVGIIANIQVYFRSTSLYTLLVMLVLLAGGLGLMARALKAVELE